MSLPREFVGYALKSPQPLTLEDGRTLEVYSVSDCVSPLAAVGLQGPFERFRFDGVFVSLDHLVSSVATFPPGAALTAWVRESVRYGVRGPRSLPIGKRAFELPGFELIGYDVIGVESDLPVTHHGRPVGETDADLVHQRVCSPLTCDDKAVHIDTNRFGLFDHVGDARHWAKVWGSKTSDVEPTDYEVFEVWLCVDWDAAREG